MLYLTRINWARPRNTKNPPTSVHVVINIVAEVAGSLPKLFIMSGITAPATAAINKFITIAIANTSPS